MPISEITAPARMARFRAGSGPGFANNTTAITSVATHTTAIELPMTLQRAASNGVLMLKWLVV